MLANPVCCHLGVGSAHAIWSTKAARVHHGRERCSDLCGNCGPRAAAGEYYRVLGCEHAFGREPMDRRSPAAASRARLDRRPQHRHRVSVGGGTRRAFAEIAAEFVHLKVSIIVTWGTPATIAAKQATSVIPVVAAAMGDPLATGIAVSLARPGGNVTGLSVLGTDLAGKRLELLREVVPNLHRLAILANIDNPATVIEMSMVQTAARTLGLEVVTSEIRQSKDIAVVFDVLKSGVDALYFC